MKKTLTLLVGMLVLAALPGRGLMAQMRTVDVTVATLDNAAVSSVTIYAGTSTDDYYYDADHLASTYTGTPIAVSTLTSYSIIPDGNGHYLQDVSIATFGVAMVVAVDENNNVYVHGLHTSVERAMGIFHAHTIFDGVTDTLKINLTAPANMLMTVPATVAHDLNFAYYTSLASAFANAPIGTTVTLDEDLTVGQTLTMGRTLSVSQNGKTVTGATAEPILVTAPLAAWNGNAGELVSTVAGGSFFKVTDGIFSLSNAEANVAATLLTLSGSGSALVGDNMVFTAASTCFDMDATSTGYLAIPEAMVLNDMAVCNLPVNADAYRNIGTSRFYGRTITIAAASATPGESVYVARKTAAGQSDTIAKNITLNLNGDTVLGTIVHATNMPVIITNGVLNTLSGDGQHTGLIDVRMLLPTDSLGLLVPGNHSVIIENGRVKTISPATGANVSILAGKFGQPYKSYLAPRHSFVANTDADAASFPAKVIDGYTVTLVNYNAEGDTTSFVANTANNQIHPTDFPVLAAQDNVAPGSPYTFLYWACNETFTTPWVFDRMVLTKDTTLYAKWAVYNPSTDIRVYKVDYVEELDNGLIRVDSLLVGVLTAGANDTTIYASVFAGFQTGMPAAYHLQNVAVDTVLRFNYLRDTFNITWDLQGGSFTDGHPVVEQVIYGSPISYPATGVVSRTGYTFSGWSPNAAQLATMPAFDIVITAQYDTNRYNLTWNGANSSVVYNGLAATAVSATFTNEYGTVVTPALNYYNVNDPTTALTEAVKVGVYTVKPADDGVYHFNEPASTTLTITRAPLHLVTGSVTVEEAKLYDGLASAVVTDSGTLATVFGTDDVRLYTIANFDSPAEGTGKTITAYFTVMGDDAYNYSFATTDSVVSTNGAILLRPTVATDGITVDAGGYCDGDSGAPVVFVLSQGSVDEYKLEYSSEALDEGFTDVDWTAIATPGVFGINVPLGAEFGDYTVTVTLRSSAYPQYESAPVPVLFHVNLTKETIKPVFADVITIVDTVSAHMIDQPRTKWYHMGVGETAWTLVGEGPYYKEEGGTLTGQYYAEVVFLDGTSSRTCAQDDMVTLVEGGIAPEPSVTVYPNPTVGMVSVKVENATAGRHTFRVMNVMGVTMLQGSFDGDSTTIDFDNFVNGSYTVSVDGIVVRVIKK